LISAYFKGERNRGIRFLALSIFSLLFIFSIYSFRYSTISLGASPTQYQVAQIVIILTVVCIAFGVYGIFQIIKFSSVAENRKYSLVAQLNRVISERYQFNLAILSSILYGLFFAFLSKIIIYIPHSSSSSDGLSFPSVSLALCCGAPGYFPMATLRLTESFSILFIPLNVVLAVFLSVLVGLNVALNVHYARLLRLKESRKVSAISSLGAFAGLFIGCPTCSGGILFTVLGIGAGTTALVLAPFQSLFILMSLPVLILTPFLMVHKMKKSLTCEPDK
jgi:hypothetical protein